MKFSLSFLVVVFFAIISHITATTSPTFLWSGRPYFTSGNAPYTSTALELTDLLSTVSSMRPTRHNNVEHLANRRSIQDKPYIVLHIAQEDLQPYSANYAISNVYSIVKDASSSVVFPHAHIPYQTDVANLNTGYASIIRQGFPKIQTTAPIYLNHCESTLNSLGSVVAAHVAKYKNNGGKKVIPLYVPLISYDENELNNCIHRLDEVVNSATNGQYMNILTGFISNYESHASYFIEQGFTLQSTNNTNSTGEIIGPAYVTSNTITALLVSFILLGLLFFGISYTLNIQTPPRYAQPHHTLPPTREY